MGLSEAAERVVRITKSADSGAGVTAATYTVLVHMNEDSFTSSDDEHIANFAAEFQRALDDGYFTALRYDALTFEVVGRDILHSEPGSKNA